jgi:hypothetical protein
VARSREGSQRPCLYPILMCALRQPAWQMPRWCGKQVGGVWYKGAEQRLDLASQTVCVRARVHGRTGVREGARVSR